MLGRHRLRWEGNIKNVLKETGWVGVAPSNVAQEGDKRWAVLRRSGNFSVTQIAGYFLSI
jgi:hypothetical protein